MSTNPKKRKPSPRTPRRTLSPAEWKQLNAAIAREVDRLLNPEPATEPRPREPEAPATINSPDPKIDDRNHPAVLAALDALNAFGSRIIGTAIFRLRDLFEEKKDLEWHEAQTTDLGNALWESIDAVEGPARQRRVNAALEAIGSQKRMMGDGQIVMLQKAVRDE